MRKRPEVKGSSECFTSIGTRRSSTRKGPRCPLTLVVRGGALASEDARVCLGSSSDESLVGAVQSASRRQRFSMSWDRGEDVLPGIAVPRPTRGSRRAEGAGSAVSAWTTVLTLPLPLCWNLRMSLGFSKAQLLYGHPRTLKSERQSFNDMQRVTRISGPNGS